MHTTTVTVTTVSRTELLDALRPALIACDFDPDFLYFAVEPHQILRVASDFDLATPTIGTLADVIRDSPPRGRTIWRHTLQMWIAVLTDEHLYGDAAWPKTDYLLEDS